LTSATVIAALKSKTKANAIFNTSGIGVSYYFLSAPSVYFATFGRSCRA
jgi:hypothetical protein